MSTDTTRFQDCTTAEELALIQKVMGDTLRMSMEDATQSKLPEGVALLLLRLALTDVLSELMMEEAEACEIELAPSRIDRPCR